MSWIRGKGTIQVAATLLMLAVLGSAIAMWSDALKVMVTVKTGDVNVEFGQIIVDELPEAEGKDVGACYASVGVIEDEDNGYPTGNNDLDLNITIVNAYPSYNCTVVFEVRNTGTIPVKGPHITPPIGMSGSFGNNGAVSYAHNMTEVQIDPGQSVWFKISFHVEQSASENSTYTLELKLMFHQWNEEPS